MRPHAVEHFERFLHPIAVLIEKAGRNVDAVVGIDTDQFHIEGGVMNPRKRQSVRHNGLSVGP